MSKTVLKELNEVYRRNDFEHGPFECVRCGRELMLWWNGGELDETRCKCGMFYKQEYVQIDLVGYEEVYEEVD